MRYFNVLTGRRRLLAAAAWFAVGVGVILLVQRGYTEPWTGFGTSTAADGEVHPAKTLWDWMDLLVVPLFLALAAWFLDHSQKRSDALVETDRQHQETLDACVAVIREMLLDGRLPGADGDIARTIARTSCLAALRSLDPSRKALLLQFLYESGLIGLNPVINLNGADLTGADLDEAVLNGVELRGVRMAKASLRRAYLNQADLRGTDFTGANLSGTSFRRADLRQAILTGAIVSNAMFDDAQMEDAIR